MTTFIVCWFVAETVLEAAVVYMIWKRRHILRYLVRQYLGINSLAEEMAAAEDRSWQILRKVTRIRNAQRRAGNY